MTTTSIPTRAELVRRAHEIAPILQEHAVWNEQHGRLHDQSIEVLEQAGLFRLRTPQRYGGYVGYFLCPVFAAAECRGLVSPTPGVAVVICVKTGLFGAFSLVVLLEGFVMPVVAVA